MLTTISRILQNMRSEASTITSKWQVTIPESIRKQLSLKVSQRIAWKIESGKLVGRRIGSISELEGSLKSDELPSGGDDVRSDFAKAAVARHERISKQKR